MNNKTYIIGAVVVVALLCAGTIAFVLFGNKNDQQQYPQQGYAQGQPQQYDQNGNPIYPQNQQYGQQQGYNQQQMPQQQQAPAPVPTVTQTAVAASHNREEWKGQWWGSEGTNITITPTAPGTYRLAIEDLDGNTEITDGYDNGDGISFKSNGGTYKLSPSSGDATGLTALMGQKGCLKVEDGWGYCRQP